jgi:Flp pilus assembly protein TadD
MKGARTATLLLALGAGAFGACATQQGTVSGDAYEARRKLAHQLIARSDWSSAFAYVDQLHRERPRDVDVLVMRGTIYRERNLPAESEADLREAIGLEPDSAEAHAALGILYDVTLRASLAEAQHRAAVKLAPGSATYLNNLGFSMFLRGKSKEAIGFYEQAARIEPTSRRVRTNLGFACAAAGDLSRASHEFEMGGTPAEAKNNLGFAYERRGDLKNAYDLYLEATRLDPKSTHARQNLVHAAQVLGREVPPAVANVETIEVVPVATTTAGPGSQLVAPAAESVSGPEFGPPFLLPPSSSKKDATP